MTRDWPAIRAKVKREGRCRVCHTPAEYATIDPAHIVPRSLAPAPAGDDERNGIPLCRACHDAYDAHALDILPVLSRDEQAYAVFLLGLAGAHRHLTPTKGWAGREF